MHQLRTDYLYVNVITNFRVEKEAEDICYDRSRNGTKASQDFIVATKETFVSIYIMSC